MNITHIYFYRKTPAYEDGSYALGRSTVIAEVSSTIVVDSNTRHSDCSHQPYPSSMSNRTTTTSGIR